MMCSSGSQIQLEEFHEFLNASDKNVKFTLVWSKENVQLLDTKVILEGDMLSTDLYKKATVLKFDSCHPRKMVQSLPFSQMLRARSIVTDENAIEDKLQNMARDFRQRVYPRDLMAQQQRRVLSMTRPSVLKGYIHKKAQKRIAFLSTYNNLSHKISNILNRHWPILCQSFSNMEEFKKPSLMSYRRPTNLRDRLVKSEISGTTSRGKQFL